MKENLKEFMDDPWWIVTDSVAETLENELSKELSSDHILYAKKALAVARREDNDDVVYWIKELDKFAVVHLTYGKEISPNFPKTELYTLAELETHCKHISSLY